MTKTQSDPAVSAIPMCGTCLEAPATTRIRIALFPKYTSHTIPLCTKCAAKMPNQPNVTHIAL